MARDGDDEDRGLEATKLFFESYKHFTTLSTAVALIALALFRELDLTTGSAIVCVSTLGITLLLSLIGMLSILPAFSILTLSACF